MVTPSSDAARWIAVRRDINALSRLRESPDTGGLLPVHGNSAAVETRASRGEELVATPPPSPPPALIRVLPSGAALISETS
jgi:hypothetical protein